ncbi:MAG TPA: thiamine phosphate synthase [Sulfurivirga caldicuralii]|nr:thiamine phosphate synthase [Sulfurivirga caldicuralii]
MKGLYAITDPALTPGQQLFEAVEAALRGGCRIVQYRDKLHLAGDQLQIAHALRRLCADYGALFIVNDDITLTRAVQADGVHLGKDDAAIDEARFYLGRQTIIGVSCYNSLQRAQEMARAGADYVAFGRLFPSRTKPHAQPASLHTLRQAKQQLQIPIVAIGGITLENADQVIEAGADMLAVIHGLFGQTDIEQTASKFNQLFQPDKS